MTSHIGHRYQSTHHETLQNMCMLLQAHLPISRPKLPQAPKEKLYFDLGMCKVVWSIQCHFYDFFLASTHHVHSPWSFESPFLFVLYNSIWYKMFSLLSHSSFLSHKKKLSSSHPNFLLIFCQLVVEGFNAFLGMFYI